MKVLYTAVGTAVGGRAGHAESEDGLLKVDLAIQKELGGPGGKPNPEVLFACGYAACFGSSIEAVARKDKGARPERVAVTARVGIGQRDDGAGFGLIVELQIQLAGVDRKRGEELIQAADLVCPYSNATRGNVPVALVVVE